MYMNKCFIFTVKEKLPYCPKGIFATEAMFNLTKKSP